MYREMRRKNQQLSEEESAGILEGCTSGVMAVLGDGDYPYTVPISYVYDKQAQKIYFHSAKTGHKIDAVRRMDKASFCVIDKDEVVPEKFTTRFRSVIVFGRVRVIESGKEWEEAIKKLAAKYAPGESSGSIQKEINTSPQFVIMELAIEHMSGKEGIELVKEKKKDNV